MRARRAIVMIHCDERQIICAWHHVVHIACRQKLPVLVVGCVFQQGLSDPLDDSAMHLPADDHWVHHIAEVVTCGEPFDRDFPSFGINLNLTSSTITDDTLPTTTSSKLLQS